MKIQIMLLLFLLIGSSALQASAQPPAKKANSRETKKAEPFDKATAEKMASQCARLETEAGNIDLEFYPESAPETVRNFLNLISLGAFDTTTFSRVVPGFVIQGGMPDTKAGITRPLLNRMIKPIPDEPSQIKHQRGILSMARADEPNTASSSFFILLRDADYLDGKFAAFGRVIAGMEVVDAISKKPVVDEKPEKPVKINKAILTPCAVGKT